MSDIPHEIPHSGEHFPRSSRESIALAAAARAIGIYEDLLDGEDIPKQDTEKPANLSESLARLAALSSQLDKKPPLKAPKVLLDSWIDLSFQPDQEIFKFEVSDRLDPIAARQAKVEAIVEAYRDHPDLARAAKDFRAEKRDAYKDRDDKFGKYIAYARAHRRPTPEEEAELWKYIEAGIVAYDSMDELTDETNQAMMKAAIAQRILHVTYMKHVVFVVMEETVKHAYKFNNELLAVEGNVALINVINRFHGERLGRQVVQRPIRQAVVSFLASGKKAPREDVRSKLVPRQTKKASNAPEDIEAKIRDAFGSTPPRGPKSHDVNFSPKRGGRNHGRK